MLLRLSEPAAQASVGDRGPPVVLALFEREGSGAPPGSADILRMRVDSRIEVRSHFQVRKPRGLRARRLRSPALPEVPAPREQGTKLQRLRARLPDDRARRSSAALRLDRDSRYRFRAQSRETPARSSDPPKGARMR